MISNRHILVLTLSFGSGHVRAAHATAQALRHQSPDADVRVVDALEKCRRLFRAFYVWPYWLTVRYWPALWGHYFASRVNRKSQGTAPEWAFRWGCPKAFEMIASFEPDTIIAAEVGACEIAVIAKRTGLTKARIINLVTDYQAEPAWVKAEVDAFAVADQGVREQLIRWGAPARKIVACGIPTDPTFARKHDLKAHRPRFGLSDDHVPLVLVMGGGMGQRAWIVWSTNFVPAELPCRLSRSRDMIHGHGSAWNVCTRPLRSRCACSDGRTMWRN
jgi:processive 1,2-diacylglycerol beta-glucosyltransferase